MPNIAWKRYDLGTSGRQYLSEELAQGKTFAQLLLTRLDEFERVETCLPRETSQSRALQFRVGGLLSLTASSRRVIGVFEYHLFSRRDHCVILEEPCGSPDDPYLRSTMLRYAVHSDEVYYLLTSGPNGAGEVESYLRAAYGYPFIAALTRIEPSLLPEPKGSLSGEILHLAAKRTDCVVVGAYDGEGYIVAMTQDGATRLHFC